MATATATTATAPPLEIRNSDGGKGRSLHATRSFAAGATLHAFTSPALVVPTTTHLGRVCSHCLRPGDDARACSGCRAASYCDAACQAAAWAAAHARECRALRRCRQGPAAAARLPTPVRALVVLLLLPPGPAAAVDALRGCVPMDGARRRDLDMMAVAACEFAGVEASRDEVARAVGLLCKLQTNAFHSFDADLGQVAIFVEPTLAMANHSCVPNALVQFIGRKAILTAERPIEAGDEIEISYTDYTHPLAKRQQALAPYSFRCRCRRCRDDLNVYQVCAAAPRDAIPAGLSLVPRVVSQLRHHPALDDAAVQQLIRARGEAATASIEARPVTAAPSLRERHDALLAQYRDCADLVTKGLWAVAPVPELLTEVSIYFAERGDFAFSLAVACLVATACDTHRFVSCFHPVRAKNLLIIAKLLANTAEATAALHQAVESVTARADLDREARQTLGDIDQVSLCQMLLTMVLRSAPAGHSQPWGVAATARDMLHDIEQLPGRAKELSLITAWIRDPSDEQNQAFFDYAVVQQVEALAKLGRAVLQLKFGTEP